MLNNGRKAIFVIGAVIVVLVVALVAIALLVIAAKQKNFDKIAPAMANRWKGKDQPPAQTENKTDEPTPENTPQAEQVN